MRCGFQWFRSNPAGMFFEDGQTGEFSGRSEIQVTDS
jgi:hypothetical protein